MYMNKFIFQSKNILYIQQVVKLQYLYTSLYTRFWHW